MQRVSSLVAIYSVVRAPMTSSFVKVTFSLIRKVPVCFFPVIENVLTQMHIQLAAGREFMI